MNLIKQNNVFLPKFSESKLNLLFYIAYALFSSKYSIETVIQIIQQYLRHEQYWEDDMEHMID